MSFADDEYYLDMLDGLAIHLRSPLLADLSLTISRMRPPGLGYALNANQVRGKQWLIDNLAELGLKELDEVLVLGGWYAVLSAMLLGDPRFDLKHVTSLDLDPGCEAVARSLNRTSHQLGRFTARTGDMLDFDYAAHLRRPRHSLLINTSCEHLPDPAEWLARVPAGSLLVLQSNDYFDCNEHVSCVADLPAFETQMPLGETLFRGTLKLKRYTRFMQIGRR